MAKKKAASSKDHESPPGELNFEQSLQEVEQIVARLEGGQLGLSDSLQQYELGIRQLKRCHELLDAAEQRVSVLAGFDAEGNPVLESLQVASESRKAGSTGKPPRKSRTFQTEDHVSSSTNGDDGSDDDTGPDRPGLF